jgi:hypothetical protein
VQLGRPSVRIGCGLACGRIAGGNDEAKVRGEAGAPEDGFDLVPQRTGRNAERPFGGQALDARPGARIQHVFAEHVLEHPRLFRDQRIDPPIVKLPPPRLSDGAEHALVVIAQVPGVVLLARQGPAKRRENLLVGAQMQGL